jgi:UV DNA damage endonuclease
MEENVKEEGADHTETIDLILFNRFLKETQDLDFDRMLEIKDREKSALKAIEFLRKRENKYFVPSDSRC